MYRIPVPVSIIWTLFKLSSRILKYKNWRIRHLDTHPSPTPAPESKQHSLGALFLQETPNSLIQQKAGDPQKANLVLQKIRGTEDVQAELSDLMNASMVSKSVTHPFKEIIKRKYRPQLVMAFAIPCFQEVTGINVITFYGPILLRTTGLGESASLLSTIVFRVVSAASTFVSMLIVDKVGRRVLFIVGGMQMLTSQIMVGSILATQLGDYGSVSKGYAFALLILICLYVSGFSLSWGPLGRVVPSEIFPLEIRSAGQSITVATNFLTTLVIAQSFLPMLCHFRDFLLFWGLAGGDDGTCLLVSTGD